ncbi:two-component system sensor histidine kinase VicK [Mucilaginibacter sp. UYNi724]
MCTHLYITIVTFTKDRYASILTRHAWLYILLLILISCSQKKVDDGEYSDEFIPIFNRVNKLYDTGKVDQGVKYLDSAYKTLTYPTLNDRFRYYSYLFIYHKKVKHQYQQGLLYADSMLQIAKLSETKKQYAANFAEANFAKGDAYFELKQFNDAYQYYYNGYLTGKKYLNNLAMSDYTYRMGMIMYKKGHYSRAANYFKDSYNQNVNIKNDFPNFFRKQELLDNIGLSYRHSGQNDSALHYFNATLNMLNQNQAEFKEQALLFNSARGVVYGNMADIYITRKNYTKAAALLKKSIAINLQKGYDNADAELSETKLGQIYLETGQLEPLKKLVDNLRNQLDTVKNPDAEADWNRLLGNYYIKQNNLQLAVNHIQRYNILKDSISQKASLLMESDVNQQLSNYEKQHEIDILNNENKLQVIYLYVSVFFAVMALIIVLLVYRNWKRSKRDLQTVNVLNGQINEQNYVLEKALSELNTSSQEKDRILRTVAHDLRNPIGGIASLTTMMADDDYTDEQKELINLLKETSFNSLELINEILEATNLNSVALNLERVEINSLVNNSVELLRFKAAEKGQTILLDTLPKAQELYISREKIWRVISNLISNAIKFSPGNGEIHVKVAEVNGKIIIAVQDHGIGIPDKLKDEVFNMFTSAQRPGTSGEKSFGLGLSICRQIMEKHHGKIWFESEPNIGSTFFISLPIISRSIPTDLPEQVSEPMA